MTFGATIAGVGTILRPSRSVGCSRPHPSRGAPKYSFHTDTSAGTFADTRKRDTFAELRAQAPRWPPSPCSPASRSASRAGLGHLLRLHSTHPLRRLVEGLSCHDAGPRNARPPFASPCGKRLGSCGVFASSACLRRCNRLVSAAPSFLLALCLHQRPVSCCDTARAASPLDRHRDGRLPVRRARQRVHPDPPHHDLSAHGPRLLFNLADQQDSTVLQPRFHQTTWQRHLPSGPSPPASRLSRSAAGTCSERAPPGWCTGRLGSAPYATVPGFRVPLLPQRRHRTHGLKETPR